MRWCVDGFVSDFAGAIGADRSACDRLSKISFSSTVIYVKNWQNTLVIGLSYVKFITKDCCDSKIVPA